MNNLHMTGDLLVDPTDPPGLDPEEDLGVHPDEEEGGHGHGCQEGMEQLEEEQEIHVDLV